MNAIDFIRESAAFMVRERPDLYEMTTAVEELSTTMDELREGGTAFECALFSSFVLLRIDDDGAEEFILARKATSMVRFEDQEGVLAYSHDPAIGAGTLKYVMGDEEYDPEYDPDIDDEE